MDEHERHQCTCGKIFFHTAIWSGNGNDCVGGSINFVSQQIQLTSTGGRYNPVTDTWISTSQANVPQTTCYHSAVWTGSSMIVHGGIANGAYKSTIPIQTAGPIYLMSLTHDTHIQQSGPVLKWLFGRVTSNTNPTAGSNTGKIFDPIAGTWTVCSTINAPSIRYGHSAVFSGTEMIVWEAWWRCIHELAADTILQPTHG